MNAPTVVFAYNRPEHLRRTLSALAENRGADKTELFVFVDGPKNECGKPVQTEVINVAKSFEGSFKSMNISACEKNKGLARSVIGGVSEIIEKYGRSIVIEDDSVSAKGFLSFMNDALDFYENDPEIWSVGGYTVPMKLPEDYEYSVIKTQRSSSYAWATWKDRWEKIDWEVGDYGAFKRDHSLRRRFNLWGSDRAGMLDNQMNGAIDSWAIRFDYAMFKNGMYNIIPAQSLIQSIGRDGSGTHDTDKSKKDDFFAAELSDKELIVTPEKVETDERIRREFCKPFYLPLSFRAKEYIKNVL